MLKHDNRRMTVRLLAALALVLLSAAPQDLRALVGTTFPARVTTVLDGDTIEVVRPGTSARMRVRLEGIDSPERGEPYSNVARTRTRVLVFDKDVRVSGKDVDRYGRLVARVVVQDAGAAVDVSVALVREGLACYYTVFATDPVLARAENDARTAGRGFWAPNAPQPACAAAAATGPPPGTTRPATATVFIGNVRSRVYHLPTCRNAGCPNCTRRFASRDEAEAAGFRAAGDCQR
jgi:endonuclease YncB( thermonuclease family)